MLLIVSLLAVLLAICAGYLLFRRDPVFEKLARDAFNAALLADKQALPAARDVLQCVAVGDYHGIPPECREAAFQTALAFEGASDEGKKHLLLDLNMRAELPLLDERRKRAEADGWV